MATKTQDQSQFLDQAKEQLDAFMRGPWSAAQVAHVAGVRVGAVRNWHDRDFIDASSFLKLTGEGTAEGKFTTAELFQVCVLAELGKYGIAPARADYVVDAVTRDLFERAFGRQARGGREPAEWWRPGYLVAEQRVHRVHKSSASIQKLAPEEVPIYLADEARAVSPTFILIETGRLLRRILTRMGTAHSGSVGSVSQRGAK